MYGVAVPLVVWCYGGVEGVRGLGCGVVWCGGVVEGVRGLGCGVVWCCVVWWCGREC